MGKSENKSETDTVEKRVRKKCASKYIQIDGSMKSVSVSAQWQRVFGF